MWMRDYLKDPAVWIAIVGIFLLLTFTEGCAPLHWTDKGVKLHQPITETLSINGKGKVKSLKNWQVQLTLQQTFNTEELF